MYYQLSPAPSSVSPVDTGAVAATAISSLVWNVTGVPLHLVPDASLVAGSDFGKLEARRTLYRQRVGRYIVSRPLTFEIYWNAGGYTCVISDFDSLYGYGQNPDEAVEDALIHLEQDRDFYGQIQNGTKCALDLRDRLRSYLVQYSK